MAEKDISEKILLNYNDVFADVVNVLLYQGNPVISPESLEDFSVTTQFKTDDTQLHEQERDVAKYWKDGHTHITLYGIENQTEPDPDMPLRIMSYDGASYKQQILDDQKERFPVISLVLYYGKNHWIKNRNLKERISIPSQLDPYVNDYKVNVFEIAWLSDEQIQLFKSDFRVVADFFVQKRKHQDYVPSPQTIQHVDAVLKLLSVFTMDDSYRNIPQTIRHGGMNMCEVVEYYKWLGVQDGIDQGIKQGIEQGIVNFIKSYKLDGLDKASIIAKIITFFNRSPEEADALVTQYWEI